MKVWLTVLGVAPDGSHLPSVELSGVESVRAWLYWKYSVVTLPPLVTSRPP